MKHILLFVMAIAAAHGETALRVKWGVPLLSRENFYNISRDVADTVSAGWVVTSRYEGAPLPTLTMYCPEDDVTVCALYDDTGYIAGLQVAVLKSAITELPNEPSQIGFVDWTVNGEDYYVNQQYYISEETLSKSAEERGTERQNLENATLADGGVWLPDLEGKLMRMSKVKSEIASSIFTEQACIPSMGIHYYYNLTKSSTCDAQYPWFGLVSYEELIGTGFVLYGKYTPPTGGKRMWFEQPPKLAVELIVPRGPQCTYDLAGDPGLITLHIYYTKQRPWTIGC